MAKGRASMALGLVHEFRAKQDTSDLWFGSIKFCIATIGRRFSDTPERIGIALGFLVATKSLCETAAERIANLSRRIFQFVDRVEVPERKP